MNVISEGLKKLAEEYKGRIISDSPIALSVNANNYLVKLYSTRQVIGPFNAAMNKEMKRSGIKDYTKVSSEIYIPTSGTAAPPDRKLEGYSQLESGLIVPTWLADETDISHKPFDRTIREIHLDFEKLAESFGSLEVHA